MSLNKVAKKKKRMNLAIQIPSSVDHQRNDLNASVSAGGRFSTPVATGLSEPRNSRTPSSNWLNYSEGRTPNLTGHLL